MTFCIAPEVFNIPAAELTPEEDFADARTSPALNLALAVTAIGTIYLGIMPARILEWTASAALNAIR